MRLEPGMRWAIHALLPPGINFATLKVHNIVDLQGVVTPICAIVTAKTGVKIF